jgi:hypothetical protein
VFLIIFKTKKFIFLFLFYKKDLSNLKHQKMASFQQQPLSVLAPKDFYQSKLLSTHEKITPEGYSMSSLEEVKHHHYHHDDVIFEELHKPCHHTPACSKPCHQQKPCEKPKPACPKPCEQPKPACPKPCEQPKPACPKPCEQPKPACPHSPPCASKSCSKPCSNTLVMGESYTYTWTWFGWIILWFIVFTIIFWLIYYSLRPSFVLDPDSNEVDTGKVLLASVISAIILEVIIYLVKFLLVWCGYRIPW